MAEEVCELHLNELRQARIEHALLESECANLRAAISALELPSRTERPKREKLRTLVKGNQPFVVVNSIRQAFAGIPHSLAALKKNLVRVPTKLQKMAWPVLMQGSDTLVVAPKGHGKLMSLIPIIVHHARTSRVIAASTQARCRALYSALLNNPGVSPIFTEYVWDGLKSNVICVPFAAFPRVARYETGFVCVLDALDVLAEQGHSAQLHEILRIVDTEPCLVLATARSLSRATVELSRKIEFPVVIGLTGDSGGMEKPCATYVEVCPLRNRYDILQSCLKSSLKSERVVLIVDKNRAAANLLELRLCQDGIDAQSLHSPYKGERELARVSLEHGLVGVYIVIPSDFAWLQEVKSVDLLINFKSVRSPSAFSMRVSRVKSSGVCLLFLKSADLVGSAAWLVPLLRRRSSSVPSELLSMFTAYNCLKKQLMEASSRNALGL